MRGSIHTDAIYTFDGKRYGYRAKGMSQITDLTTASQREYALETAINNGASKVYAMNYHYNTDKYDYEVELLSAKIIYIEKGKRSRKSYGKRDAIKQIKERHEVTQDQVISRKEQQRELKMNTTDKKARYREKQPQKRTFKSVEAYRKERRLAKLKK